MNSATKVQLVALNCFSPSEQETLDFANAIRPLGAKRTLNPKP